MSNNDLEDIIKNVVHNKSAEAKNQPQDATELHSHADLVNGNRLTENAFPFVRMRRLRQNPSLRKLVRENQVTVEDLIYPIFVEENIEQPVAIDAMPGVRRETEDSLADRMREVQASGVKAVMLFGVSHNKDHEGSDTLDPNGLLSRMIYTAKQAAPDVMVIADLCFCEYTDHGHCGPINHKGDVDNDKTLENVSMQAVIAAEAGADMVAPSGMMDGQVSVIRHALDVTGFSNVPVMAYAAKFASVFYGPFRDAAGCALGHRHDLPTDRKSYQLDPANGREAIRDALMDEQEGADILMVKPGIPYLDILTRLRDKTELPLAAYQISGEYAMIRIAAEAGAIDYQQAMMESLMAFKRAGADMILTYSALDVADWLSKDK
ncbi:MAG: porphobilinogen synthase [Pseudomonadota bacterium]